MKKYIIIILSFLGLFFINVGIVSANGNLSSKLTATEVKEIKNRIQEAGLPINHRDDLFKKYKGWTDYAISISRNRITDDRRVELYLYTRSPKDIYGWQPKDSINLYTYVIGSKYYYLQYDTFSRKWYWDDLEDPPLLMKNEISSSLNGYVIYSTEPVTKSVDNEFTFFTTEVTSGEKDGSKKDGSDKDDGILESIGNFFKGIFMPDKKVLDDMVNDTKAHIESKFPFLGKTSEIEGIFETEKSIKDKEVTYGNRLIDCYVCEKDVATPYLGRFDFKVIDSKYLNEGINRFRPIIRGFIVLMLLFYNFNQFLGFIGQKSSTTFGKDKS